MKNYRLLQHKDGVVGTISTIYWILDSLCCYLMKNSGLLANAFVLDDQTTR